MEIPHHGLGQQLRVQLGHPIDGVTAHRRQMGHAHIARTALIDNRQPCQTLRLMGKPHAYLIEKTAVDLVNDLQMARQHRLKQRHRPLLQRLRQQGVIGVGKGLLRDPPGRIPIELVLIHQQPHQLRHRNGRMGVVQLSGVFGVKLG